MDRSHIANNQRQPRNPLADGDGWINPRLIRVTAGSRGRGRISAASRGRGRISASSQGKGRILSNFRRRSRQSARDDEGLIHHLWSYICRSHIGEPAGSVGASPLTGGVTGSEGGSSPTGCVTGSEGGTSPTGGVTGGEGSASPTGSLAGGEGDAIFEVSDNPVMADEEFLRRYGITDSDKVSWERNKDEAEREVKTLFGEDDSTFEVSDSLVMSDESFIPPPCTGLPGDFEFELCRLKCATRRYTAHAPSDDELNHLVLEF
ncbi:hypothetical protein SASPL_108958 [Salvia splendens]|uniref:Uncharacterized protein n=1 Tax=Salvia splendens TaxID=180675 RepID=A0A8X8YFF3_SALSN|nr:hypothetical protein SASPL_108958 [Salvia splendens]